jgi:hypothetical protein
MTRHDAWTTENEVAWLKNIGQHTTDPRMPGRIELLKSYIEGAKKRRNWAGMDRAKVMSAAHLALFSSSQEIAA